MIEFTVWDAARVCGAQLGPVGRRSDCPVRKHRRKRNTSVWVGRDGRSYWKCWSCDPPHNSGDGVALYAAIRQMDRTDAYRELVDRGIVEGKRQASVVRPIRTAPRAPAVIPPPEPLVAPPRLAAGRWTSLLAARLGTVERWATARSLDPDLCRAADVVCVDGGAVGFGYRDPLNGEACRVKASRLDRSAPGPRYWIEPKSNDGGKAIAPLYLAHLIEARPGGDHAVITEGEADALALRQLGLRNVVSLPDGSESASRVPLDPISAGFGVWLIATDADPPGDEAYAALRARAKRLGVFPVRLTFGQYKDANDALVAGMTSDDAKRAVRRASRVACGFAVEA